MNYTLMHQRVCVAEMEIDDASGVIKKIGALYAPEHLPPGILVRKGAIDRKTLNEWWEDRSIPDYRPNLREVLKLLDLSNPKLLPLYCFGLSLSDQYWIRPEHSDIRWENVNFFDNGFSEDVGDVLFDVPEHQSKLDLLSPDNTTDGNLKKRWKIIDGKRCLIKGGSHPFRQQPLNEVIASEIMERLRIPHIPYTVIWNNGEPYSVCEDFVSRDTELVPAWRIIKTRKKNNSTSFYLHFIQCCESLGIPGAVPFLDRMIVLDYLIANEDRHLNNFGVLRDARTLRWIGFAPIYDSGSSLGYDKTPAQIRTEQGIVCKPFKNHHSEQLKLVSDFSWIDFARLSDVQKLIETVLSSEAAGEYIEGTRIRSIADSVQRRITVLSQAANQRTPPIKISNLDDVEKNVAADYR